jgi:putative colanic acid biosynthesis UDP-glucose lipid carrier transferase
VQHNDYYAGKIQAYMTRHKVKPGMTGWAQVNGSRGETETLEKMKRRLEYDLEYINTWSIWLDMQILLKTPLALLKDEAY